MYAFLFFFAILGALAYVFYSTFLKSHRNYEQQKTAEQPTHFDLLDDNGDPIPSSDDRARSSAGSDATIQSLRHFCIKDKGYHVSVWPKDQGFQGIDYIEFQIAGITHGEHVNEHLGEFVATLEPDPANPYDANAIKILARNGDRIGFVPKEMTNEVRNFTNMPCKCYCFVGENNGIYYSYCYINKI
jgi:hypothetical protein